MLVAGAATHFLYDGFNPVQELNSSNQPTANLLTGLRIDEYFTRTDSGNNVSTLPQDALGSMIGLVGSAENRSNELYVSAVRSHHHRRRRQRQQLRVHRP